MAAPSSRRGKSIEYFVECDERFGSLYSVLLKKAPRDGPAGAAHHQHQDGAQARSTPQESLHLTLEKDLRLLKPVTRRTRRGSRPAALFRPSVEQALREASRKVPASALTAGWQPLAAAFHYGTQDIEWLRGEEGEAFEASQERRAAADPPPAAYKEVSGRGTAPAFGPVPR